VRGQGVAGQQQRQQLRAATEALRQNPGTERRAQGFTQGCGGVEQGGPGRWPNGEDLKVKGIYRGNIWVLYGFYVMGIFFRPIHE